MTARGNRARTISGERSRQPLARDQYGVGGFIESIMALVVVTVGIMMLTSSFTILADRNGDDDKIQENPALKVIGRVLADDTLFPEDRLTSRSALDRYYWSAACTVAEGSGVEVWLSFVSGPDEVCYTRTNGSGAGSVFVRSEAINVQYTRGDVRVALLSVKVVA